MEKLVIPPSTPQQPSDGSLPEPLRHVTQDGRVERPVALLEETVLWGECRQEMNRKTCLLVLVDWTVSFQGQRWCSSTRLDFKETASTLPSA